MNDVAVKRGEGSHPLPEEKGVDLRVPLAIAGVVGSALVALGAAGFLTDFWKIGSIASMAIGGTLVIGAALFALFKLCRKNKGPTPPLKEDHFLMNPSYDEVRRLFAEAMHEGGLDEEKLHFEKLFVARFGDPRKWLWPDHSHGAFRNEIKQYLNEGRILFCFMDGKGEDGPRIIDSHFQSAEFKFTQEEMDHAEIILIPPLTQKRQYRALAAYASGQTSKDVLILKKATA